MSREVDLSSFATPATIARVVHYLYHQDYEDTYAERDPNDVSNLESIEPPSWPLTINAEMFVTADQLGMHALKDLAMEKTKLVMEKNIWWKDFGRGVRIVYESTPPGEQEMRQLYIDRYSIGRHALFKRTDREELMVDIEATGRFATDVSQIDIDELVGLRLLLPQARPPRTLASTVQE